MTAINLTLLPLIYATAVRFTLIAVSRNRQLRTLCTRLALHRSEQGASTITMINDCSLLIAFIFHYSNFRITLLLLAYNSSGFSSIFSGSFGVSWIVVAGAGCAVTCADSFSTYTFSWTTVVSAKKSWMPWLSGNIATKT